jgi:Alanine racemase, N-terminal domain
VLTLRVDEPRWRAHLAGVLAAQPGTVPVVKGNGYGFGVPRLARVAADLGADTVAVGTHAEVAAVGEFPGSVMVLTPWRGSGAPPVTDDRVVHTVGRREDLLALTEQARCGAEPGRRPRVVLELLTSMRRHGSTARDLRRLATEPALADVTVEGFALHLPLPGARGAGRGGHLDEVERLLTELVASGIDARRVFVSHLSDDELDELGRSYGDLELRPRTGTRLWLGDRSALRPRATVLEVHELARGDRYGYRQRQAPRRGHLLVVSGGTAHGIGLEAPGGASALRDRAARMARGGLDAAGIALSPFTVAGRQRRFAEPPHLQVSMVLVPSGTPLPAVGDEVDVQVRYTATAFDRVELG